MTDALPVSVKAALRCGDRWVLLKNERDEWELPGGRVEPDDQTLRAVVARECHEELGFTVQVGDLIDTWLFEVIPGKRVVIVCFAATGPSDASPVVSHEHTEVDLFRLDELAELALPEGYRSAIHTATNMA